MPQENQSEIFIRLLADALQADRLTRKASKSRNYKDSVKRSDRLFKSDLDDAMHAIGPLDCVQLMASATDDLRNG